MDSAKRRRAVLLMRVSTDEQNPETQRKYLQELAEKHNADVVAEIITKESAKVGAYQEGVDKAIKGARQHKYDLLIAWDIIRISRKGIAATLTLLGHFAACGVDVLSYQQPWLSEQNGLPADMKPLLVAIVAWIGKMENDIRSYNTKKGVAAARAKGKTLGRPKGAKDSYQRTRRWETAPTTDYW